MPDHMGYDPNFPTFKHSDKFESRAMVKMMQKEATLAERAWEERTSQRDNNKVFFNHLTRDEAAIEMRMRMEKYEPDKDDRYSFSATGEKISTALLDNYHSDIAGSNLGMKELRKAERMKKKTEKLIAKAVEKKTGGKQEIVAWPPPEFPDAEIIFEDQSTNPLKNSEISVDPENIASPKLEGKTEFKKRKALPPGLAKRLAAKRKAAGLPEIESVEKTKPDNKIDQDQAKKAAEAAMSAMGNITIPGFDPAKMKALLEGKPVSAPPGLKPGENPQSTNGVSYVNMPSEVPLSIPGLPAGWKFGDEMPTGFVPEEPEKPNVALEIAQSTQKKRRRPDQPVIFQKDAMGALVDPSRFNTSIEQENLTPKQPGYYIQKRKEEEELKRKQQARMMAEPKVIASGPKLSVTDQYSTTDFQSSYSGGATYNNGQNGGRATYGTYDSAALDVNKHRNKYNRYKGGGVSGGGYR